MKKVFIYLLLLLPVASYAQLLKTFNKPDILFTAKYPDNWVNKIKEGNRVFFTSPAESATDDFRQNINVSVTTNP